MKEKENNEVKLGRCSWFNRIIRKKNKNDKTGNTVKMGSFNWFNFIKQG